MQKISQGYLYSIAFVLCATITYLGLESVYRHFPEVSALDANVHGFIIAVSLFSLWYFGFTRHKSQFLPTIKQYHWLLLTVSSLTSIGAFIWFFSVFSSNSGVVSILGNSQILWSIVLGLVLLKEKINIKQALGIISCVLGITLIGSLRTEIHWTVFSLFLLGNFLYAVQSFLFKKYGTEAHVISFTYWRAIIITLLLGLVYIASDQAQLIPLTAAVIVGSTQLFGFLIARVFYFKAHQYLPISHLHTVIFSEPVLVLIMGIIVFGHPFTLQKLTGMLLIIGGLLYFVHSRTRTQSTPAR